MNLDVSVIIVNYNTRELTLKCIDSVFVNTSGVNIEVILVDNGSNDGSREQFESDPRILYIYSEINLGFGKANNLGYSKAKGKYLFLLNSDTVIVNNAIYLFFKYMETASMNIACCGSLLRNQAGQFIHSYGHHHTWLNLIQEWCFSVYLDFFGYKFDKYDDPKCKKGDIYIVGYVTGADVFIRKSIVDELGLFDPDFFMYYEDAELGYRLFINGYSSVVIEGPQIIHLEGCSNRRKNLDKITMVLRNMMVYMKKIKPPLNYFLFSNIFKVVYIVCFLGRRYSLKEKAIHIYNVLAL